MITREAAGTLMTHAGPEIGVASTKAFTCQLTALFVLAMYLGQARQTLKPEDSRLLMRDLLQLPAKMEHLLADTAIYEELEKKLYRATDFLYLGRGIHFPIALEGALKLKEISYIHAEGYPAGEMKHGPNALIDSNLPVVVLVTRDPESDESKIRYEKTLSNIQEVKAREGIVVAVCCAPDEVEVRKVADHVIVIPRGERAIASDPRGGAATTDRSSHSREARMRCRPTAKSGEERDGRITQIYSPECPIRPRPYDYLTEGQ